MHSEKDTIKRNIARGKKLSAFMLFFGLLLLLKVLAVQYLPRGYNLRKISNSTRNFRSVVEPAKRGNIYSSDGKLLATTQTMYHVYMDFKPQGMTDEIFNNNVRGLASGLSKFFGNKSTAQYERELRSYRAKKLSYVRITPRLVNHLELMQLRKLPLWNRPINSGGRIEKKTYVRDKPYETLAQRTIGRPAIKENNVKGVGIESSFDKYLAGTDGISYERRISGVFWAPINTDEFIEPIDGMDVVSTIDIELQDVAEDALKNTLSKHQANWGTAILMECSTGHIKAIANITRTASGNFVEDYNYALGASMEPGSTFKLATLIALIEDAGASLTDMVDCGTGRKKVGARVYVDSDAHGYGNISLLKVFEKSSNIGFAYEAEKHYGDDPQKFVEAIKDIGFLDKLDLQIAGETPPLIRGPKDKFWDGTSLGMMSTGYSAIMLNPLRTLMLFNAVANNGKMVAPLFVDRVEKDGHVVEKYKTKVINDEICSESTLQDIRKSLEGVVYEGTGALFLLNKHYQIAGKTGTAQILTNGTYVGKDGTHYLGSFAGYFPADSPKYSCIVAVKTFRPHGSGRKYYGGTTAGPVFKAIADRVFTHAIDWGHSIEKPILDKDEREKMEELAAQGKNISINAKVEEPDKIYTKKGDIKKLKELTNILDIDKNYITFADNTTFNENEVKDEYTKIPSVIGMGLNDAIAIFSKMGIKVTTSGKGRIIRQSIRPGSEIKNGSVINLTLTL